jgi:hypothetical protein
VIVERVEAESFKRVVSCRDAASGLRSRLLAAESAEPMVADIDPLRAGTLAASLGARVVSPGDPLRTECDALAPCALGGIINDETLPELRCRIIAGGANNVLAAPEHVGALDRRRTLYAPWTVMIVARCTNRRSSCNWANCWPRRISPGGGGWSPNSRRTIAGNRGASASRLMSLFIGISRAGGRH